MDSLPECVFANMVQCMGFKDRFASCRVNKRFHAQIYRVKIPFQVEFPCKAGVKVGPLIQYACVDLDSLPRSIGLLPLVISAPTDPQLNMPSFNHLTQVKS